LRIEKPGLQRGFQCDPLPLAFLSFLLISSFGNFNKRKQIERNREVLTRELHLLLIAAAVLIAAATVLCITALALLIIAEDF